MISLGDYMYQGSSNNPALDPAQFIDKVLTQTVAQSTANQVQCRAAQERSLQDILSLLDILGIKIAHHAIIHMARYPSSKENMASDAALAWMQTSLEDIAATVQGISIPPQEKP
ncbi:hypothetical protein AAFM46_16525 (plasmid) [Arthrobacter sp. TMP15]|uniref:hypothetical protein n=1 Tax=Arthrobacter sp. TMP15 TaxID=3140789 RepID=UPI0031BAE2ED